MFFRWEHSPAPRWTPGSSQLGSSHHHLRAGANLLLVHHLLGVTHPTHVQPSLLAVAAVHDGYVLSKTMLRSPLAGAMFTHCFRNSMAARGNSLTPRYLLKRVEVAPGEFKVSCLSHKNADGHAAASSCAHSWPLPLKC